MRTPFLQSCWVLHGHGQLQRDNEGEIIERRPFSLPRIHIKPEGQTLLVGVSVEITDQRVKEDLINHSKKHAVLLARNRFRNPTFEKHYY